MQLNLKIILFLCLAGVGCFFLISNSSKKQVVTLLVPSGEEHEYKDLAKSYERASGKKFNIVTPDSLASNPSNHNSISTLPSKQQENSYKDIHENIAKLELQLKEHINSFGKDHTQVARVRVKIGRNWFCIEEYENANDQFKQAQDIFERAFGDNDPNVKEVKRFIRQTESKLRNVKSK